MTNADDLIRSFGMSAMLITEEIRSLEHSYDIELGHIRDKSLPAHVDYYPQFEQSVRVEAARMAEHYEVFYCLEKAIRQLITENCKEVDGDNWWAAPRIPQKIVDEVAERAKKETDNGVTPRSEFPIDYTTFGELSVIITTNWSIFATIFKSQAAVQKVMASLNLLRGPIAHCCLLSDDEAIRLRIAVRDWFRMIG